GSVLRFRHAHHQTVQLRCRADLTGEPRIGRRVLREVQHRLFHFRFRRQLVGPSRIDIDMTGGAGAGAAAIRIDAGNAVLDRPFHHRPADAELDDMFGAVILDIGNFYFGWGRHQPICFLAMERSASFSGAILAPAAISLRPTRYSGAALTASTAAATPSRKWKTANFRALGSPRSTMRSSGRARPAICSFKSYWSDQNHGTSL